MTNEETIEQLAAAESERDDALAQNAELRASLSMLIRAAFDFRRGFRITYESGFRNQDAVGVALTKLNPAIDDAESCLTTSPPAALAKFTAWVKAEALREICKDRAIGGLCQRVSVDYLDWTNKEPLASQLHARPIIRLSVIDADEVMREADRLEKEAAK